MNWTTPNQVVLLSYVFLYLAVILLWLPAKAKFPYWGIALGIAMVLGVSTTQIEPLALGFIALLVAALFGCQSSKLPLFIRIVAGFLILLVSFGFVKHLIPGFHNLKVLNQVYFSQDAIAFSLYQNFDTAVIGILILGITHPLISSAQEGTQLIRQTIPKAIIVVGIIIVSALLLHFVNFDPKWPQHLLIWLLTNLFLVCVAEEALFRGFIQRNLALLMGNVKYGNYMAIVIAAILFGLIHLPGGNKYVLLATIAGMGYGWVYYRTQRIEVSILTHFSLNLIHLLGFTYPALASAIK